MSTLLTKEQLANHLYLFRKILTDFDYGAIENIRFFNLESLYYYMDHVENNPFKKQYEALERELDFIQPYLPFVSSKRANDFLVDLSKTGNDEEVDEVKKAYTQKLRLDFINMAKTITTDEQWQTIIDACEEIRQHKEEMLLALN